MTTPSPGPGFLGTQLRRVLDLGEAALAEVYADLGLAGFRLRYTPVVRALAEMGPSPIRDLARAVSVTHSAASQTVNQMSRKGLVTLEPGEDARQRIVHLTPSARALLPLLDAEWRATEAAATELEAELSYPVSTLLAELIDALERRPMRERIAAAAARQGITLRAPDHR
jgi:DNA-binding MarR family transcriptional regulator